jgi:hypothetical protein
MKTMKKTVRERENLIVENVQRNDGRRRRRGWRGR